VPLSAVPPVVGKPRDAILRVASPCMQEDAEGPFQALQGAYQIFQRSREEGVDFKQAMADAIAGEYDRDSTTAEVMELAASAPLVLFTWESSPACKKALKYISETGVEAKIIRLDDPWAEGNPRRAALGRLTGKSSVPSIWIGGKYIGGCDDGPSEEAPGLVPLAFRGQLFEKLEAAGATGQLSEDVEGSVVPTAGVSVQPPDKEERSPSDVRSYEKRW